MMGNVWLSQFYSQAYIDGLLVKKKKKPTTKRTKPKHTKKPPLNKQNPNKQKQKHQKREGNIVIFGRKGIKINNPDHAEKLRGGRAGGMQKSQNNRGHESGVSECSEH